MEANVSCWQTPSLKQTFLAIAGSRFLVWFSPKIPNSGYFGPSYGHFVGWYKRCSAEWPMERLFKSRKILIPDVPPPRVNTTRQTLVIAGIGVLCATGLAAVIVLLLTGHRGLTSAFEAD